MPRSEDDYRPRRTRSPELPDLDRDRRKRRDRDEEHDSRRSEHRSSRDDDDDRRRHYSRSPSGRDSRRRDDRRRERRERSASVDGDRRRRRSPSRDRHRRRHRDRDEFDDRDRDRDRASRRHRSTSRSRSPAARRRRSRSRSRSPRGALRSKGPLPSQKDAFSTEVTKKSSPAPSDKPKEKEKPNFSTTGRLAAESNTVTAADGTAVVLKYHEPPEARKPPARDNWRLYVFKGSDLLEMVELSERSCWLIGRERLVVDFPVDHPSCSKQHAAIQFRYVEKRNEFGDRMGRVRPYLIDLESANGSTVNGDPVPPGRYVELRDKDVLKFGLSTREYVLMLPPAE